MDHNLFELHLQSVDLLLFFMPWMANKQEGDDNNKRISEYL